MVEQTLGRRSIGRLLASATILAGIAVLSGHTAARAQSAPNPAPSPVSPEAPPAAAPADQAPAAGDIVVTARHRTERLQDVPISATVVQGVAIAKMNLNNLNVLSQTIPSVHIGEGGKSNDLYIRGTGSGSNQSFDQSVGIFIDDVYHGRSRTTGGTFLDLAQVEVLKGPQSTYFGNNAIAGAINIVTQKPGSVLEGYARALYGMHGQYAMEAAYGGPVTDRIGVRGAINYSGMNGWLDDTGMGIHVPHERNLAGRLTAVIKPNDDWEITGKFDGSRNRQKGSLPSQITNCPPPSPLPTGSFCKLAIASGTPLGIDNNVRSTSPGQGINLDTREYALTNVYDLHAAVLTAVTAWQNYKFANPIDADNQAADIYNLENDEKFHQFSQEVRLASPASSKVDWLVGAYYQSDELQYRSRINPIYINTTINTNPLYAALRPYGPFGAQTLFHQWEKVYSVFGSVTVHPLARVSLSAGLRQSWDDKNYDLGIGFGTSTARYNGFVPYSDPSLNTIANGLGFGTASNPSGSRHDKALMPSARIQYTLDPNVMAYFSYNRGFKAGGFNGADVSGNAANIPFKPEHVNAYEIGIKSKLFDRKVTANIALFKSDYTDLQFSSLFIGSAGTLIASVRNVGQSVTQGVETELGWNVNRNFNITAQAAYDDSHYVTNPNVSLTAGQTYNYNQCRAANPTNLGVCAPLATQDLSGRPTEYAPKWAASVTPSYTFFLPRGLQFEMHVTGIYSGGYFVAANDDPETHQAKYLRVDAGLTLESPASRWAVDIVGKNLTDRKILEYKVPLPLSNGTFVSTKAEPWNVAAQLRYRF